jgi:hypothetical protein
MDASIGIIISVVVTLFNAAMFLIIRCNDLKHLEISVKDLKATVEKTGDKLDSLSERISSMEGKLSVSSKNKLVRKRR